MLIVEVSFDVDDVNLLSTTLLLLDSVDNAPPKLKLLKGVDEVLGICVVTAFVETFVVPGKELLNKDVENVGNANEENGEATELGCACLT